MTADGQIGPKTVEATTAKPADEVVAKFCDLREAHYKSLPTFATFGKGWMNRLASVESEAKTLTA